MLFTLLNLFKGVKVVHEFLLEGHSVSLFLLLLGFPSTINVDLFNSGKVPYLRLIYCFFICFPQIH